MATLKGKGIGSEIDALVLLELGGHPVQDGLIKVLSAEDGVTVGGLHLKDATGELQDGDIEGTTSEIVDSNRLVEQG